LRTGESVLVTGELYPQARDTPGPPGHYQLRVTLNM
jgi:hypothetical protein